jgi:hypothetical protein
MHSVSRTVICSPQLVLLLLTFTASLIRSTIYQLLEESQMYKKRKICACFNSSSHNWPFSTWISIFVVVKQLHFIVCPLLNASLYLHLTRTYSCMTIISTKTQQLLSGTTNSGTFCKQGE